MLFGLYEKHGFLRDFDCLNSSQKVELAYFFALPYRLSFHGKVAARDIVQFVPFSQYRGVSSIIKHFK